MAATVEVSIVWDGTRITISNVHDMESLGSPSDSNTTVHDVADMIQDAAHRAEGAVRSTTRILKEEA